jgi:hypothetical protein
MKPEKGDGASSCGKQRRRKEVSATRRLHHPLQVVAQRKSVVLSLTRTRISRTTSYGASMMLLVVDVFFL